MKLRPHTSLGSRGLLGNALRSSLVPLGKFDFDVRASAIHYLAAIAPGVPSHYKGVSAPESAGLDPAASWRGRNWRVAPI